mmetsp:Transcript_61581/g.134857  ORF Transcript_61581/g.134857 Transcript_61581/m.134857 type:complete len:131 (-) Transcript_61581:100-492(-)
MWRLIAATFVALGAGAEVDLHRPGEVVSVPLTLADGPAGPGLQLGAREQRVPIMLGPQLDVRITPGKPKLRPQVDSSEATPWTSLLRLAFCLTGFALVWMATVQQEAEQGRMSRFKKMCSMLMNRSLERK